MKQCNEQTASCHPRSAHILQTWHDSTRDALSLDLDTQFSCFIWVPAADGCLEDRHNAVIKGQKEEDVPWL